MPVVAISVKHLNKLIGQDHPQEKLVQALEQLGCDVEDTVNLFLYKCPACGAPNDKLETEEGTKRCEFCGHEDGTIFEKFASDKVIRIDLLADRPDLFNVGGLARSLRGYLDIETGLPQFALSKGELEVNVDPAILKIRPYIVCAEAEVPALDHNSLREIMKLQENLHWGIGRDRKLSSIGVYNLDTIKGPITYTGVKPDSMKFYPLGYPDTQMTPAQILEKHPKGVGYAQLLQGKELYPILKDNQGMVLSMPPIINSEETRCQIGTTKLFIDVTGISEAAVVDSLNILTTGLIELGAKIKTVKVNYPDKSIVTPDLKSQKIEVGLQNAKDWIGVDFTKPEFEKSLRKMCLGVQPKKDGIYEVQYPAYRSDIRHEVDIFEDLAIGYGFDKIEPRLVPTMTVGSERAEEKISNIVRDIMLGLGYTEIMSLNLNSIENHITKINLPQDNNYVVVGNPKTINQKVVRKHLMSGILETLEKNKKKVVPQAIFELANVVCLNPEMETGTNEYRHVGFAVIGPDAGYAEVRAVLDSILRELGLTGQYVAATHPAFIEGRYAEVSNENGFLARVGELHPKVITNFNLAYPIAYCELRLIKVI